MSDTSDPASNASAQAAAVRAERLKKMTRTGLYLVTDDRLEPDELIRRLDAALAAGCDVVQFRDKRDDHAAVAAVGRRVAERCRAAGALFIMNDYAELSAELGADGIHVGQEDASPAEVRAIVGTEQII